MEIIWRGRKKERIHSAEALEQSELRIFNYFPVRLLFNAVTANLSQLNMTLRHVDNCPRYANREQFHVYLR